MRCRAYELVGDVDAVKGLMQDGVEVCVSGRTIRDSTIVEEIELGVGTLFVVHQAGDQTTSLYGVGLAAGAPFREMEFVRRL